MHNKQFHPLCKKYQNRIWREVQRHKLKAQTSSFRPAFAAAEYLSQIGFKQPELSRFSQLGRSWCSSGSADRLFALTLPQIAVPSLPRLELPQIKAPEIESPKIPETTLDALEELVKAFKELKGAVLEAIQPIVDWLLKVVKKFSKWAGGFWDHIWCKNKHWYHMAEHHKKRRIRKKYRNKIKREARRRSGEFLELLMTDNSEDDETASDDEEGS